MTDRKCELFNCGKPALYMDRPGRGYAWVCLLHHPNYTHESTGSNNPSNYPRATDG